MKFDDKTIWMDGKFIPWRQANMSVLSHHYGMGVFEGVRGYATNQGAVIFRLSAHTDRLFRSAHILGMKLPYDKDTLNQAQQEIMLRNQLGNAYLRPFAFYGGEYLGLSTAALTPRVIIAAVAWQGAYAGTDRFTDGLKVRTSSLSRNHINSVFSKAKANGNYMNSILAMQEAQSGGMDDAIMLDHRGCVAEGSGANIFIVRNNVLYTPDTTSALEGITRDTVITLAKDLNLMVIEKNITRDELYIADEIFFTGTAVEVTPIREVDGRLIATGERGPITQQLQQAYALAVRGENSQYDHWLTPCTGEKVGAC